MFSRLGQLVLLIFLPVIVEAQSYSFDPVQDCSEALAEANFSLPELDEVADEPELLEARILGLEELMERLRGLEFLMDEELAYHRFEAIDLLVFDFLGGEAQLISFYPHLYIDVLPLFLYYLRSYEQLRLEDRLESMSDEQLVDELECLDLIEEFLFGSKNTLGMNSHLNRLHSAQETEIFDLVHRIRVSIGEELLKRNSP